jgi:hypothetical protein
LARELTRQRSAARSAPVDVEDEQGDEIADDDGHRDRSPGRRSRRGSDEEETTRTPNRRQSRRSSSDDDAPRSTPGGRGWAAHKANAAKSSKFGDPNEFRVEKVDEEYLIKFLESEPFWSYLQHFVREIPKGAGKKQFACLGEDCPLCDIGYAVTSLTLYNIVDLSGPKPVVKYWVCTARPSEQIEKRAKAKSSSPLDRDGLYFVVSKTEDKSGFNTFDVSAIKESDVEDVEGWEDKVLTDEDWDAIDAKGLFDESVVVVDSLKALRTAAEYVED